MKIGIYNENGAPLVHTYVDGADSKQFVESCRIVVSDSNSKIQYRLVQEKVIYKKTILEDRDFNYYFNEGDVVIIDPKVPIPKSDFTPERFRLESHIGKLGIVKKCWCDLHAFGRGSSYYVIVDFDGIEVSQAAGYFILAPKEDGEDVNEAEFFKSKEFKDGFSKAVEKETWDKGLPKIYMDDEGWLVEHWKDGKINKLKKLK